MPHPASPFHPVTRVARSAWIAAPVFVGLTIAATWPLARGLGRDVPSDYGDPLYMAWAMAWVMRQIGRMLTGHADAFTHFWDANQMYPEPATLALSDHFIAQALPLAPIYWLTGNAILTLGLAYMLAFVLMGFCMWLLVRDITGSSAAGILAGVVFAFNPYFLILELPHLQVISAQWMPLALFGLRRYFEHGSRAALAAGALSLVALNLSAGYYLLMFPPFVLLYVAWELTVRGRWRHAGTWRDLVAAGLGTVLLTLPFVWPYIAAQQRIGFGRTVEDAAAMAAGIDGYLAAVPPLVAACMLAGLALVVGVTLRVKRLGGPLPLLGFAFTGLALAFWLSLGPTPTVAGVPYPSLGLYRWLIEYVPGMTAVRVSSRFAAVFVMFLAVLAGMGAALVARIPRVGPGLVLVLAGLTVFANAPRPFPLNLESPPADVHAPAPYLRPGPTAPPVYRYLSSLPAGTIVAELPFTDLWYNTRYLYFSTFHWHPLVNGFTSFFPPGFNERVRWLVNPVRTPDEAWRALASADTTHVVLHTGAWDAEYARQMEEWLVSRGARRDGAFDGAVVYAIDRSGTSGR